MTTFAQLSDHYAVTPIRDCPGRYFVRGAERIGVADLAGEGARVSRHRSAKARDPVIVARIDGGGLISYEKPDGSFVHTLCNDDAFARKLEQLGIDAP